MHTVVDIRGERIGRIRGSVRLFRETFRFMWMDRSMLLIPVIASLLSLCVLLGFSISLFGSSAFNTMSGHDPAVLVRESLVPLFLFYVANAAILAWMQAGIAHIVYTRVHGGDATVGDGMRVACSHMGSLFVWACIASTVGILLRVIAERSALMGKLMASVLGLTWSVLTYFVVQAIVLGKRSPVEAIRESGSTFRRVWGETIVTNFSFGFISLILLVLWVGAVASIYATSDIGFVGVLALAVFAVFGVVVIGVIATTLDVVLRTLLYVYAAEGTLPESIDGELVERALKTVHTQPPLAEGVAH